RAGVLELDLAARLLFERLAPAGLGVPGPLDQVELAFPFADRGRQVRGARRGRLLAARAAARGGERKRSREERHRAPTQGALVRHVHLSPSVSPVLSISSWCSGLHSSRTAWPFASSAWADEVSRFWRMTCSSPPRSS